MRQETEGQFFWGVVWCGMGVVVILCEWPSSCSGQPWADDDDKFRILETIVSGFLKTKASVCLPTVVRWQGGCLGVTQFSWPAKTWKNTLLRSFHRRDLYNYQNWWHALCMSRLFSKKKFEAKHKHITDTSSILLIKSTCGIGLWRAN